MFQVFDNGKPADAQHHNVGKAWANSKFNTLEEARAYANDWLGPYGGVVLQVGIPYNYSGYNNTIEIREV